MEVQLLQPQNIFDGKGTRVIRLRELHQNLVYEGLLEGLPTTAMNQRHLENIPKQAHQRFPWIPIGPYIVPPIETPVEYSGDRPYPFGEPAQLPSIICISRWNSFEFEHLEFDYSTLIVVWFQNRFALPIDAEVVEHIEKLNWEALSHKYES